MIVVVGLFTLAGVVVGFLIANKGSRRADRELLDLLRRSGIHSTAAPTITELEPECCPRCGSHQIITGESFLKSCTMCDDRWAGRYTRPFPITT